MDDDFIISLAENEVESGFIDFKEDIYDFSILQKKKDFLVDVLSFANSHLLVDKYIITGVNLLSDGSRDICGVTSALIKDGATYQNLVSDNIEPTIDIDMKIIDYKAPDGIKKIVAFKVSSQNSDQPYMLSKDYGDLKKGFIKVRKGQRNDFATRRDFDEYYKFKSDSLLSSLSIKCLSNKKLENYACLRKFINSVNYEQLDDIFTKQINVINEYNLTKSKASELRLGNNVSFEEEEKNIVKNYAKAKKIKLSNQFFDVGNLTYLRLIEFSSGTMNGSESEKEKYKLLSDLIEKLKIYFGFHDFYNTLSNYRYISLVIENSGKKYDEEIEITLKIKKSCFLNYSDFPVPSEPTIKMITDRIEKIISIENIKGINSFNGTKVAIPPIKQNFMPELPFISQSKESEYENDIAYYKELISTHACYDYSEDGEYVYLIADLKSIRPNEKIKFPAKIIFKDIPDKIEYEIKSKLNPNIKKGTIKAKE